ncbi:MULTISPECIES: haloacid dehalogenase-like hydrolase [Candidatus Ichthyocystis]|uniref:Putative hydrolase, HAD domain n=1 Tax=Candidatus Ichthyocystis hellenicum TaxID=1561003 RepID=A0A0S4M5H5_9BURK|nr:MULTISPECIES: haloacid dehalogenase-like hydrolase [Ichthyocystis]CUT17494.1 putative hydrolase, HAD domain [Candidatus Ichthyocystis hellenicum]
MDKTIAIVFDFDDTLANDSTSNYLRLHGVSPSTFWKQEVQKLVDRNWDFALAWIYVIMNHRKFNPNLLTLESLKSFSKKVKFFPGVKEIFGHIRSYVASIRADNKINVEFYIISSGIGTIIENCAISNEFTDIWSTNLLFDAEGNPIFIKNIVSFTEKTKFLFQIHKGIVGNRFKNQPFAVNEYIPNKNRKIPFENIIFIGDGYTDIPCFSVVKKFGGKSICVYGGEEEIGENKAAILIKEGRVTRSVLADYRPNSPLHELLLDSIHQIATSQTMVKAMINDD